MTKRKTTINPHQSAERLKNEVNKLHQEGYVAMPVYKLFGEKVKTAPGWEDVMNAMFVGGESETGGATFAGNFSPVGNEHPQDDCGTKGLGWMEWGTGNRLPNYISLFAQMLPYTAAGVKFNIDTAAGLGPQPMYRYTTVSNGSANTEMVDYTAAGPLIQAQIAIVRDSLAKLYADCRTGGIDISKNLGEDDSLKQAYQENRTAPAFGSIPIGETDSNGNLSVTKAEIRLAQQKEKGYIDLLTKLERAYEDWEKTSSELQAFIENNNLDQNALLLFGDMYMLGICFPELQLSMEPQQKDNSLWKPKVTGIGYRSALTCRLERMDTDNVINYVYISNSWLDWPNGSRPDDFKITALPAINIQHPLDSLKSQVRKFRLNTRVKSVSKRPTRFILPSSYPTVGRPYYPQMAWHSIFGGEIYSYAANIISDRATRKRNSNNIGQIIYVHTDYLQKLYLQKKATTDDEQNKLRDELWNSVNQFLRNRNNSGQSLLAFTFTGNDGKEHDAFRIVSVENTNRNNVEANKSELEELGSIIFFTLEVHPDLIGAVPGRTGSSGGTYQREMYLIKQMMMAPLQRIVLTAYSVASQFNEWDKHLTWVIRKPVLTTLDRNKTGIEELNQ